MAQFRLNELSYYYPGARSAALADVSLSIEQGEFVLLTGPSGGGKSTLARLLAGFIPQFYGGTLKGDALFEDASISDISNLDFRRRVGMLFQEPERQIIMHRVERDLAFGMENLALPRAEMQRRVTTVARDFGLANLLSRKTQTLSSGEKQRLALASLTAMTPDVLVLDEPSSQLDPAATEALFSLLKTLNSNHGLTIILVEHRANECFQLADRVLVLDRSKIALDDSAERVVARGSSKYAACMPSIARLFAEQGDNNPPISVDTAKHSLRNVSNKRSTLNHHEKKIQSTHSSTVLKLQRVCFGYEGTHELLQGIDLKIDSGCVVGLAGENGAGKSTLLKIIAGLLPNYDGNVFFGERNAKELSLTQRAHSVGYLGQDPDAYLFHDTVKDELLFSAKNLGISELDSVEQMLALLQLQPLASKYPRDLSAGERQRVALGTTLVAKPTLLLLDEPTRGSDGFVKAALGSTLRELAREQNCAIVVVTQDIEFIAEYADRMLVLHDGQIANDGRPQKVIGQNTRYQTAISQLFADIPGEIVSYAQAARALGDIAHVA